MSAISPSKPPSRSGAAAAEIANLRKHEQQLLAAIPFICIGLGNEGIVTHWNPVAAKVLGPAAGKVVGEPFASLNIRWSWDRIREAIERCQALATPVCIDHMRFVDSEGRDCILSLTFSAIQDASDAPAGFVITGADITERKHMESQLVLAEKMESLGQLAAGIAHEINTPTQYVGDNMRFLKDAFDGLVTAVEHYQRFQAAVKRLDPSAAALVELEAALEDADLEYLANEIPKAIGESLGGIDRVSRIVRAMKEFSHPDREDKELADLNRAIESTVTVSRNEWKYVANVDLDLDSDLPPVPCLLGGINQVLLNLIVNAAQSISDVVGDGSKGKGTIRISTRQVDGHVEMRLSDTGTGIDEAILDKIFDPFFTTKQVGKGTGQGLALAHNIIVEKHGGTIGVETEVGAGATFIVRLPLAGGANPHTKVR